MSIDFCKSIPAIELEVDDEIDLDNDEYGDNELAMYGYAVVLEYYDWRDEDGDLWVTLCTSQGKFDCPAGHSIKVKVIE